MGVDWTVVVAAWLTERPRRLVPLPAFGVLLRNVPREHRSDAAAVVLAVLDVLEAQGLVVVAHHFPTPVIGVLDCAGLRRVAEAPGCAIQLKVAELPPAWRPVL